MSPKGQRCDASRNHYLLASPQKDPVGMLLEDPCWRRAISSITCCVQAIYKPTMPLHEQSMQYVVHTVEAEGTEESIGNASNIEVQQAENLHFHQAENLHQAENFYFHQAENFHSHGG